ncbi:MAG: hypothetical protein M3Y48_19080 [Actinomycetota bacterium]|nr:hypothetical protein [Actinomycetota bacterium]
MNRVLEVRPDDMDADVQLGVTKPVERGAEDHGIFFPRTDGSSARLRAPARARLSPHPP